MLQKKKQQLFSFQQKKISTTKKQLNKNKYFPSRKLVTRRIRQCWRTTGAASGQDASCLQISNATFYGLVKG